MRTVRFALLLAVLASAPGCVVAALAAGAGATYGAIKYFHNEAVQDFGADLDTAWAATLSAMRDLGYPVDLGTPHGATEGRVESGDAEVVVEQHPGPFTRVRVRVGTFDTEDHRRRASLILEAIAQRL